MEDGGQRSEDSGQKSVRHKDRRIKNSEVRRQENYIYGLRIIALISFKISLMEGIFDGLISPGVCL